MGGKLFVEEVELRLIVVCENKCFQTSGKSGNFCFHCMGELEHYQLKIKIYVMSEGFKLMIIIEQNLLPSQALDSSKFLLGFGYFGCHAIWERGIWRGISRL